MPKYIDADALIKTESELLELRGLTSNAKVGHLYALCILTTAKPADVAPVKRGTWIKYAGHLVKCSVCGYEYIDRIECDAFCGNCGARMDLKT